MTSGHATVCSVVKVEKKDTTVVVAIPNMFFTLSSPKVKSPCPQGRQTDRQTDIRTRCKMAVDVVRIQRTTPPCCYSNDHQHHPYQQQQQLLQL